MIIAQISDIHASPDNDNLSQLERALAWLDIIEPDALVVTGDLIDNDWFDGYETIAVSLNNRTYPTFILPGNSDNPVVMRSIFSRCHWPNAPTNESLNFVANIGKLRLIGLDSTIAGASEGNITVQLPWLEETLSTPDSATLGFTASILFLHHHVFPSGIPPMDQIMCQDSHKLADLLSKTQRPPIAIATGHVHRPMTGNLAGIPAYICGSICPSNPLWFGSEKVPPANDPPSLMIHHFTEGSLVSHHVSI